MEKYIRWLEEHLNIKHKYKKAKILHHLTLDEWIQNVFYVEGLIALAKELYNIIEIDQLDIFGGYIDFIDRIRELNLQINSDDSALTLLRYKSVYPNLTPEFICLSYKTYSRQIKYRKHTGLPKSCLKFITHSSGCDYTNRCLCELTQEEIDNGLKRTYTFANNSLIHPLWDLWELNSLEYNNYSQWFPRELVEMNLEFYRGFFVIDPNTYVE